MTATTATTLLLFFTLLFSSALSQFPEATEFEFPLTEEQTLSGWTTLDLAQANTNPQIQGLLYIGVQNATQQAVQDGSLPSGTYSLVKVNSVEQNQEVTNVQEYRFNVDVSNGQGTTETLLFEMTYDPAKGTSEVTSYSIPGQEIEQGLETETEQMFPLEEEMLFGYLPLDLNQASTDPQIQGLLQIGIKNATAQAIQNGSLPQGVSQVAQINSIEENLHAVNGEEYRFDVNISSGGGSPVSNLIFEMTYNPSSGSSEVTSYSIFNNQTPLIPTETYTPLDIAAISTNPQIQGLIAIGIQNVTQQAIQNSSLPSGTYQLGQIQSAGQGTLNPNDYQFNVSLQNNQGTTADSSFTLVYNNVSGTTNVTSYSIANLVTTPFVNNTSNNTANTTENFNNTIIPENNTENTQTTTGLSGLPEGFTPVDVNSSEGATAYQVGSSGFYSVESSAILSGQLPYSYFSLTGINGVGEKEEGGLVYYWFDINIANGSGNSARLVYTMSYDPTTGSENVLQYNLYNVV